MRVVLLPVIVMSILALCFAIQLQSEPPHKHIVYHMIHSYSDYHKNFTQVAGINNTIEMTEFGTGAEICARQICRFYVYLYQPPKQDIKYTILLTSGMHGNQLIGPTSLLYAYSILKPRHTRIIYMPVCNPSGYQRKTRQTYPNLVDVNRDFPIDGNRNCYLSSSTRILDKLFRKYKIDLTVNLHNGGDQIAWNWGTKMNMGAPKTQDQYIYNTVGQMMKYYGGYNKRLGIKQFKAGTMDQIVYPAQGTLDDWAYAGSWVDSKIGKCKSYEVQDYPKDMHQGLVFLLQLGQHNASQNMLGTSEGLTESSTTDKIYNGYVSRTLRMLRELIKFVEPVISAIRDKEKLIVKVEGCSSIQQLSLTLTCDKHQNSPMTLRPQFSQYKHNSFSYIATASIPKTLIQLQAQSTVLFLEYQIQCDKNMQNKGKSIFSKPRIYQGTLNITNIIKAEQKSQFITINGHKIVPAGQQFFSILKLVSVPILLFILFIYCFCCKQKASQFSLNFLKKNKTIIKSNSRKRNNMNQPSQNSVGTNIEMVQESPDEKVMTNQIDMINEQQI